ncbi:MAG: proline dehydrogenase family protein [Nitrospinae bacterium]|nr:proline dehydrogenase family protein [Nitrospinota bacterium]
MRFEKETLEIAKEIISRTGEKEPHFWESSWWEGLVVQWLTSSPEIKTGVLRFVDVFPALRSSKAVVRHLREYLPDTALRLPENLRVGRKFLDAGLITPRAMASAIRLAVSSAAKRFIAGSSMEETASALDKILGKGMSYTLDLLGEATLSEKEADNYRDRYVNLIKYLSAGRACDDPAVDVSLKLSSLTPRFDPVCPGYASQEVRRRLRPILRAAMETGSQVNIDMENHDLRDLTLSVFRDILDEEEFSKFDGLGIVVQAYLTDAERSLDALIESLKSRNRRVTVRLVKGAYWDREVMLASQRNLPPPVFMMKEETDATFERLTVKLLENTEVVNVAVASHNVRSVAKAVAAAWETKAPPGRFEIQLLYGMADPVKKALVDMKVPVRVYAPFGEMLPGMAYLVRRILENSSNDSFLKRFFVDKTPIAELLRNPATSLAEMTRSHTPATLASDIFVNEPETQFHDDETRNAYNTALEQVYRKLGKQYPAVIGGREKLSAETFTSADPSDPSRVVGYVCRADSKMAQEAMDSAVSAFGKWSSTPAEKRAEILLKAAQIIHERKFEMAAWQTVEVGKTRKEAMADVDEAIDHIRFYAEASVGLENPKPAKNDILGESNLSFYRPRGVGAIIAPWNFPMAIMAGMTASALAVGNTVVVKPSSNSPVCAALVAGALMEAGIPDGVVNFTPGGGETVGPALLDHPGLSFVSFTGSWETGAWIANRIAQKSKSRPCFVKAIIETGGKNAIIVDESADLDEAVLGVIASAFGFGGQKCSACSRVIVLADVYKTFTERLADAVSSLIVGPPTDPATHYGPLIDESAEKKVESYIELGMKTAKPLIVKREIMGPGYYVGPAVFGDVKPDGRIAREEIFGPLLCVIRAVNLEEAIRIANGVDYALTAGIYTRTPSNAQTAIERLEAGNVYVNRKITGAVVGRQPFGGFKRSGYGSAKAGSVELLKELMTARSVTENLSRHGFSPDVG